MLPINKMGEEVNRVQYMQEPLLNNPAYNIIGNDFNDGLAIVANPAYNNQLTNNPAYNYNGDTDPYYSVNQIQN